MNFRKLIIVTVLIFASTGALADAFNDGVTAMLRGDNVAAFKILKPLAEEGHSDAQYHIGYMYQTGTGVPRNDRFAAMWFKRAAAQGHHGAKVRYQVIARRSTH